MTKSARVWRGVMLGVLVGCGLLASGCTGQLSASARDGLWALYDRSVSTMVDIVADGIEQGLRN
jgi:hypothetical protein